MALAEAILVCLAEKPRTGYDLAKFFQKSIGFFWHADHQLIYRELKRLKDGGLVRSEQVIQQSRPNKSLNVLTDAGRDRLHRWSAEAAPAPSLKDDLAVRLYALGDIDIDAFLARLEERLEQHRERLDLYKTIRELHFSNVSPNDINKQGRFLGLILGIDYEMMWVQWCERALDLLKNQDPLASRN